MGDTDKSGCRIRMVARRRQCLEIRPDAENSITGARHDRDTQIGIGRVAVQGVIQLAMSLGMKGVVHFRPNRA